MSSNLKEEALEKLQAGDVYSVVEFLDGQEDAVAALKTYNQLQRQLYWEEKNLGLSLALGRAGLQQGLQMGRRLASTDANLSKQLVGQAKALSYNLGSFAWPGWGDEGPPVSGASRRSSRERASYLMLLWGSMPLRSTSAWAPS